MFKSLRKSNSAFMIQVKRLRGIISCLFISDHSFKTMRYERKHGRKPNWDNPKSFTEKLLWCSENYRDDRYVWYADKYLVRKHIEEIIGSEYLIPIYDVVDKSQDLDFSKYPDRFVLNATHGSHMVQLCQDKKIFDKNKAVKSVNTWLKTNYYYFFREWNYKYIKPRVIVMENISSSDGVPPLDYKFFCFDGEPYVVALDIERFGNVPLRNIYDMDWNQIKGVCISLQQDYEHQYPKPKNFEKMKELARKLAYGFHHVRVDFYNVDGKIYFGELTFFHSAASLTGVVTPYDFDLEMGSHFNLPKKNAIHWKYQGEDSFK